MYFIGVDYGLKKIGVAYSDESGTLAFPETTLQNGQSVVDDIARRAEKYGAHDIVVGESHTLLGEANPLMKQVEPFIEALVRRGFRVHREREYFTSREAQRETDKEHEDAAAAALILQRFLDKQKI